MLKVRKKKCATHMIIEAGPKKQQHIIANHPIRAIGECKIWAVNACIC
jgi:hypothetical protein